MHILDLIPWKPYLLHCNVWDEKRAESFTYYGSYGFTYWGLFAFYINYFVPVTQGWKWIAASVHVCLTERKTYTPFYLLCGSPRGSRRDESEICGGKYSFFLLVSGERSKCRLSVGQPVKNNYIEILVCMQFSGGDIKDFLRQCILAVCYTFKIQDDQVEQL